MIKFFASFFRKRDGSVAIEFSLLVWPFVILTLATIELALMYTAESLLESGTSAAARQVKTGQLQQSGAEDMTAAFRAELCPRISALLDCDRLIVEADVMGNFSNFETVLSGLSDEQTQIESLDPNSGVTIDTFNIGGSSDKVLIRAVYYYPALTPVLWSLFPSPGNTRQFVSTIVLQTEPYDFAAELAAEGEI